MVPDEVTYGSYFKVSVVGVSGKNKKITTNKEFEKRDDMTIMVLGIWDRY